MLVYRRVISITFRHELSDVEWLRSGQSCKGVWLENRYKLSAIKIYQEETIVDGKHEGTHMESGDLSDDQTMNLPIYPEMNSTGKYMKEKNAWLKCFWYLFDSQLRGYDPTWDFFYPKEDDFPVAVEEEPRKPWLLSFPYNIVWDWKGCTCN